MAERLKNATSPYLLQHADNPVDWWQWGEEAFAEARARDVPVLLSVGYSACHWCHVMAHESFEDPQTAALLNESMVAIKVDREERPDVDAVYMTATQAMTGQGGWPMTVFLTPDREPFFCGTYFPRQRFQHLIRAVSRAWHEDRAGVTGQAGQIAAALATQEGVWRGGEGAAGLTAVADQAVTTLEAAYDRQRGGFGPAPKFPPSMVLEFLLRRSERPGAREPGSPAGVDATGARALEMAAATALAMARGGMYDQLGGGFARYSVDSGWVVPHFEKMLYDNALLARAYAHLWRRTGDPLASRVARDTCAWMIRELRTGEGGFASALDADSDGDEGLFYTWTPAELRQALGPDDAGFAARVFGVTEEGTFEGGRSVLQLRAVPGDAGRLDRVRAALLAAREGRIRPGRDDKVVTAWNGLAIAALAECGLLLSEREFTAAAVAAADLLARVHLTGGRLARTSLAGQAGPGAGVLEDYACLAEAYLVLSGVTGQHRWISVAGELLETVLTRFARAGGGFYDTADDGERLLYRPADPADGPTPSGTFAAAGALLSYAALTGSSRHREAASAALGVLATIAGRFPRAAGAGLAVAEALIAGPAEIAVVGPPGDPRTTALHRTAMLAAPPGAVFALGDGGAAAGHPAAGEPTASDPAAGSVAGGNPAAGEAAAGGAGDGSAADGDGGAPAVPLLRGRAMIDGYPTVYVCQNFACRMPMSDPIELQGILDYPADLPPDRPRT